MLSTSSGACPITPGFDYRRLRGELAERMLTQKELAIASGLSWNMVNIALTGRGAPGELARRKLHEGLERLEIDPAVAFGPSEAEEMSA